MKQKLIAGNWKMNGSLAANEVLLKALIAGLGDVTCDVAVAVPAPYLAQVQALTAGTAVAAAAQDVSRYESGAYTGEVSVAMLKDFGVRYALVGHSERRQYHGETDVAVAEKAQRALAAGVTPIVCVGETLQEREAGQTEAVVKRQLAAVIHLNGHCISEIVVAYEPVWAIGTGKVASVEQIDDVHQYIRATLLQCHGASDSIRVLYGGSVKADNADAIFSLQSVGGALVGGASLDVESFGRICQAAEKTV